ncbi:hypothetical protein [Novosphingobium sp. Gsoil 351]|uniref:hypothetical protein n=1 Tax=Novosphingobium sp. Gsoil 351 TaxID=2675225 RepID=UPI0012B440F4|nr:hypothetical protein [Novosphingobium sp. Gsoil 351]QGN56176.1 hypothetical protein GKE62_18105 [Novosphingobium sp. Gsoil 351]
MKWNWMVAGTAWAGIVALAWWLADRRIERDLFGNAESVAQVATRDNVLIWGGSIPLALFVLLTIAGRARMIQPGLRWPRRRSASRGLLPLERTKT